MGVGAGWYYDSADGDVVHQNLAESLANVIGIKYFHGPYPTEEAAIEHKGVPGPPGVPNESLEQQATTATTGGLIELITGRALWVRVVEVVLGGGLILIGIKALL